MADWVSGALVRGECRDKAAAIIVPQVVGVIVGFSQADADFSQCLTKTGEMEGLGVRDHTIEVKDDRCECVHGIDQYDTVGLVTGYKTGEL